MTKQQYARVVWEPRLTAGKQICGYDQAAHDVMALGWFGSVSFDLRNGEDVAAIVSRTRAFADMIEELKSDYDKGAPR